MMIGWCFFKTSTSRWIVGNLQLDSTDILLLFYYFLLLLPLKEMLFREGLGVSVHVVLRNALYGDVADLYLVLPSCNVSLWN